MSLDESMLGVVGQASESIIDTKDLRFLSRDSIL